MRLRMLNALSLLSLLLCLAACALWARSYGRSDELRWRDPGGSGTARLWRGYVVVQLYRADAPKRRTPVDGALVLLLFRQPHVQVLTALSRL